ncbi:MAG: hypothetical protein ACK493_06070 [Planctomycetota bacterium]|nr:hypothetical protein [Blastopirellula sp.]
MSGRDLENRVLELADEVCNGTLDERTAAELSRLLDRNPEAQRKYCAYLGIHSELDWSEGRFQTAKRGTPLSGLETPPGNWLRNFGIWSLLLLSGVLLGGWSWEAWSSWQRSAATELAAGASLRGQQRAQVAMVSGMRNARWHARGVVGGPSPGFLDPIYAGEVLWLDDGLVELSFESGAKVILEGPAQVQVHTELELELLRGRITLLAADCVEKFNVIRGEVALQPIAAEFGLVASGSESAELQVFDGEVVAQVSDSWKTGGGQTRFGAESVVAIDFAAQELSRVELSNTRFVQSLLPPTGPANGILAKEDFEYTAAPLSEQNGGFGWADGWQVLSAEGNDPLATNLVTSGSLRYVGVSASGNHAVLNGQFNRVRRLLSTSFGGVFDSAGYIEDQDGARLIGREGKTVYIAYLQRISQLNQGFYGFELHRGDGNRNRVLCIGNGAHLFWQPGPPRAPDRSKPATGWAVTSEFNGPEENSVLNLGDLGSEPDKVALVVIKLTFGPEHRDELEVYVNPTSLSEEVKSEPVVRGLGNFAFDRVGLANFDGRKEFLVDHVRIGSSFAAVTQELYDSVTFGGLWPKP